MPKCSRVDQVYFICKENVPRGGTRLGAGVGAGGGAGGDHTHPLPSKKGDATAPEMQKYLTISIFQQGCRFISLAIPGHPE